MRTLALIALVIAVVAAGPRKPSRKPPVKEVPVVKKSEFDCSGRAGGAYPAADGACENYYYVCQPGHPAAVRQPCAAENTFYDVVSGTCQLREYTPACGGEATTTTEQAPRDPVEPPFIFDCVNKIDADYPNPNVPCSSDYVTCAGGSPYYRQCPGETKFDVKSRECLEADYVKTCHGKETTRSPPTTIAPLDPSEFSCEGKDDGLHPDPSSTCSQYFYTCTGTNARRFKCPGLLCFDSTALYCIEEEYVAGCGGTPTTTTVQAPRDPSNELRFKCDGLGAGTHPDPRGEYNEVCSDVFVVCDGEAEYGTTHWCPEDLVYDVTISRCEFKDQTPACGGAPLETTPADPAATSTLAPAPAGACDNQPAGNYEFEAHQCSNKFISCDGAGSGFIVPCQSEDTFYDAELDRCDFEEYVPVCGGEHLPPADPPKQPEPADPKLLAFCAEHLDGNYPAEKICSSAYISCSNGNPTLTNCPANLRYSAEEDACLRASAVVGCTEFDTPANPCQGKVDGFFPVPNDCTRFAYCNNQSPLELECAGSLVFNPLHMRCEPKEKTPGLCGSMAEADIPEFSCDGLPIGFHAHPLDCSSYYLCEEDGSAWPFQCQAGYAFDVKAEECKPEAAVGGQCLPPRMDEMRPFCQSMGRNGVFVHPDKCDKGLMCLETFAFEITCTIDKPYFDAFLLKCAVDISPEAQCVPSGSVPDNTFKVQGSGFLNSEFISGADILGAVEDH